MNKADLKLDWASHKAALYACKRWHYSKTTPKSKLAKVGVWESGKFIGVVIFGVGATSELGKRYGLEKTQCCELVRVAIRSHENNVSRIVSVALKFVTKQFGKLRLVVSFADPDQGHYGIIYQAGNWVYTGKTQASNEYIYKGKRWQGRSFRNSHKGMERHPLVRVVKGSSKHRYLMPLDKEMREKVQKLSKPYPKRTKHAMTETIGTAAGKHRPVRSITEAA